MDLKLKDVAGLLNISKTTLRRWLADGKIPAYRINNQYRFNRNEIEDWVMHQKIEPQSAQTLSNELSEKHPEEALAKQGTKQFNLYRALYRGDVLFDVPGKTKEEVIRSVIHEVADSLNFDREVIVDLLLDRERMMPTSLNNGIGIPHARDNVIQGPHDVVVVAYPESPIDYGALDKKPVNTLIFLFASSDKNHLHLLAKVAHLCNEVNGRRIVQSKTGKDKLLAAIKDWETQVH